MIELIFRRFTTGRDRDQNPPSRTCSWSGRISTPNSEATMARFRSLTGTHSCI